MKKYLTISSSEVVIGEYCRKPDAIMKRRFSSADVEFQVAESAYNGCKVVQFERGKCKMCLLGL